MQLNKTIQRLKPSATLAVKTRASKLKSQGKEIVDLSAGEPDFDTPQHIKDAAIAAMQAGKTKYTPVSGIPILREAAAKKFTEENNIPTTAEQVIVSNGGKQALHEFLQVCLEPGDEVLIVAPYWVSYPVMVLLAGGTSKIINTSAENAYRLTPEELESSITDKTRVIILNSPSNPTGAAYSREELRALGEVIAKNKLLVLSDEVYEKVVYQDFEFCSFLDACPDLIDSCLTVNAVSKAYSMTGWRVGYARGPEDVIKAMTKFQSHTTSNVNSIAQEAALAAITGSQDFIVDMKKNFWRRVKKVTDAIEVIPSLSISAMPKGALFVFTRIDDLIKSGKTSGSLDFCEYLLEEVGVAVVPGVAFGDDAAIRISVGCADEVLEEGLEKIKLAVDKL